MVRRADEPKQEITLSGVTNKQAFPAQDVSDDAAQQDNATRIQATKEADAERLGVSESTDTASATLPSGTKVSGEQAVIDAVKAGFTAPAK